MPLGLLKLAITGALKVAEFRKTWHEGSVAEKEVQLKQLELDRRKSENELVTELVELRRTELGDEVVDESAARTIRSQVLLPPLRRLGESGVEAIENPVEGEPGEH